MEEQSLKQQTKKGLLWNSAGNIANLGIRFVFGIILARLLDPDAYGVIGILTVFISVVSVFIDCGFSQALIRKSDRTQIDFSTEFFFNIGVGLLAYLILFVSAPFIADFYEMPILTPVLRVLGVGVIINSLCVVQSAQFAIKLDFKTPAKLAVGTQLFSGAIGIVLAYKGWGVWALVFQQVSGGLLNAILLWFLAGWRPTIEFSKDSFRYLWGYGSNILGASLIQQIYDNLYPLLIGKFFSASSLGLYSRAHGFASLPSGNLSGVLSNVTFPILSKIVDDKERIVSTYRRMIKSTAFIVFPLMLGMAAVASPMVKMLLNEQWYGCILYLQLLCFALIWQPLSSLQLNVLKIIGRTDIVLKLEFIKRSFGLLTIFASIPFGVTGMCVGFIIFYVFSFCMNTFFISKALQFSFIDQIKDLLPLLLNSLIMGGIVWAITLIPMNNVLSFTICVLAGASYYYVSSRCLTKDVLEDTVSLLRRKQ